MKSKDNLFKLIAENTNGFMKEHILRDAVDEFEAELKSTSVKDRKYSAAEILDLTDGYIKEPLIETFKRAIADVDALPVEPAQEGWATEKPVNDREFLMVTANKYKGRWDYSFWQIVLAEGYYSLCQYDGEEWGPYEDLGAKFYKIIEQLPT